MSDSILPKEQITYRVYLDNPDKETLFVCSANSKEEAISYVSDMYACSRSHLKAEVVDTVIDVEYENVKEPEEQQ